MADAMTNVMKEAARRLGLAPKKAWRAAVGDGYYKRTPTPKSQRQRVTVHPVPPLVDCMATLGHSPRGRKHRPRAHR